MAARLYAMSVSHPAQAARLMLEHKGIEHEFVDLLPGLHPVRVRAAGFKGSTVPALAIDGRKIVGSREISRVLDELQPDPPLFPADPARRAAVEEAEAWGEQELQSVPRRIIRWILAHSNDARKQFAATAGIPAPPVAALALAPTSRVFARMVGAHDTSRVRADVEGLPSRLDRVDALIADGTIGGEQLNAADFQIGTTVRVLLSFDDLRPRIEARPAADHAMRILPEYPGTVPPALPPEWR